jgi:ankyrin repeat protein
VTRIAALLVLTGCAVAQRPVVVNRGVELVTAVRDDSLAAVDALLGAGISPDTLASDGTRPLTEAARNHRVDVAQLLLARGAHLALADGSHRRPFDYAVEFGYRDLVAMFTVQFARDAGASPAALAWFAAVDVGRPAGSWQRVLDGELLSLGLTSAIVNQREPIVVALRKEGGRPNASGYPPLVVAARFGDLAAVTALLGASVNPDGEVADGLHQTALMEAARDAHVDVGRRLIRAGARVDRVDAHGETALMWAVRQGETEYAAMLLAAGADPLHRNADGTTPLSFAQSINHADLVRLLERYRARHGPAGIIARAPA